MHDSSLKVNFLIKSTLIKSISDGYYVIDDLITLNYINGFKIRQFYKI